MKKNGFPLIIILILLLILSASLYACEKPEPEEKSEIFGVEFPDLEKLHFICSQPKVAKGENINFSVYDGYDSQAAFVLSAGGSELLPTDGVYTVKNIQSDIRIEFSGVYDDIFTVSDSGADSRANISFSQTAVSYGGDVTLSVGLEAAVSKSNIILRANGNVLQNTEGIYTVSNITANQQITIEGIQINTVKLDYSSLGNGRITGATEQSLLYGENASTVTAVADDTYHFKAWSDGVLTVARTDQSVFEDKTVFAIFERDAVRLSWESLGRYRLARVTDEGKTVFEGDNYSVTYGDDFVFEILLADAYSQSTPQININDTPLTGAEGVYTINSITAATVIQVGNLSVNKYRLNFAAPSGITFVYSDGTNTNLAHGAEYSFSVTVDDYYSDSDVAILVNNEVIEGTNGTYTITVDGDKTVSVEGAEIDRCKVSFDTAGGLIVAPRYLTAGQYLKDFPAACKNDCRFIGWSTDGEMVITSDLLIEEDITLTALYQTATAALYNVSHVAIVGSENGEVIIADMHNNIKITSLGLASVGTDYSVDTLYMGNNITELTGYASSGALADIETIHFSQNLTSIPYMAFQQCANLTTLELPDSVTEIADYAFSECTALSSITGKNVKSIGNNAFSSCAVQNADFDSVENIGKNAFLSCSLLGETDLSSVVSFGEGSFYRAFADAETVDIIFKNGAVIGKNAFNEAKIDSIEFCGSANIGESAFYNTTLSGELTVPDGSLIDKYAFGNCRAITGATLPLLSEGIFYMNSSGWNLVGVTVTRPIDTFPAFAFYKQENMTSLVYPSTSAIVSVGDYAFYDAFKPECGFELTVYGGSLERIGNHAFESCNIDTLVTNASDNPITIGIAAFAYCKIAHLTMPNTVSEIGAYAFLNIYYPSFFDKFALSYGLTVIGQFAFENAPISMLIIPEGVVSLGNGAFRFGASGATYVYFLEATPATREEEVINDEFSGYVTGTAPLINNNCTLYVKDDAKSAYLEAWADYSSVIVSGSEASFDIIFKYNRYLGDDENYSVSQAAFSVGAEYLIQQPTNPSRQSYCFVGWSKYADTYDAFDFSSTATLTDDLILYAFWEEINYPVLYNLDGGVNNASNPASFTVNDDILLLNPNKNGYYFEGWYLTDDFTDRISRITNRSANLALYAKFVPNTYTVNFMVDDYAYNSQLITYPNAAVAPLAPTLYDYDFEGWYIGDTQYDFSLAVTSNLTIESKWTAKTYDYTFNANGGNFDGGDTTITIQGPYMTNITGIVAPVRYGYEFDCWKDSAGVIVNFPSYIGREDFNVYAVWNRKASYITFDYDGGSGTESGRRISYDTEYGYLPVAAKTGYIFAGWYDAAASGFITAESVFLYTVDTSFAARYTEISYTVSFYANGGEGEMADISLDYTSGGTLPSCAFVRTGYTFTGWSEKAEGGAIYAVGTSFDKLSTVEGSTVYYYAVWSENAYSIIFNANGGSGTTASLDPSYTDSVSLPANGFSYEGYTFVGWSNSVEGGTVYNEGAVVERLCETNYDSVTFFAQWEINSYDITLYVSLVSGEAKVYVDDILTKNHFTVLTDIAAPTIEGYRFDGWYDTATNGNEVVFPYTVTQNVAFYAQMSYLSYTVSFTNANGDVTAEGMPSAQTVERFGAVAIPTAPTANGYTFTGWTVSNGTLFDFDTPITSDIELFAGWELTTINYNVVLMQISIFEDSETGIDDSNETILKSKVTSGTITENVTVTVGITENDILRYNSYQLEGYYSDDSMTQTLIFPYEVSREFSSEDTITGTESVTVNFYVYARYLKASSALSYSGNRAYLASNAADIIVPDMNNGVVITQFDGDDYSFTALTATADVVGYDGLVGFDGSAFNLSYSTEMIDIEGLSSAENLTSFVIFNPKGEITKYSVIDGVLYFDGALCCYPKGLSTATEYSNSTVTEIMDYAFMNTHFNGFNLPNVTDIGQYAFSGVNISSFDFSGFEEGAIGVHAFDGTDISEINFNNFDASVFEGAILPDCVTTVTYTGSGDFTAAIAGSGESVIEMTLTGFTKITAAFSGMPILNRVAISDSCTVIGQDAFNGQSSLRTIIFNGEITEVQSRAFLNTPDLAGEVPSTVTVAGASAFENSGLINGKNADISGYTDIGYHAFKGAVVTEISTSLSSYRLTEIFGTDICTTLSTLTVNGRNTLENYGSFSALRSVTINADDSLLIYGNTFRGMGIASLTVNSDSSVYVANNAFYDCDSLAEVNITCDSLSLDMDSFAECAALKVVRLNCDISNIVAPFRNSGVENLTAGFQRYTLADYAGAYNSVSTVRTAENSDYYIKNSAFLNSSISQAEITSNITYISAYAFANCSELKDLDIPATVDYCERYMLSNTNLTSISMPGCFNYSDMLGVYNVTTLKSVEIIGKEGINGVSASMFKNVNSLQEVVFADSITSIGEYAFYGCNKITALNFSGISNVGAFALYGLNVDTLTVPSTCILSANALTGVSVVTLNLGDCGKTLYEVFGGNSDTLKYVNILGGVNELCAGMFKNCTNLLKISLPESIETIGDRAFMNCAGITGIYLSNKVTNIGEYAFYGCTSLSSVSVPVNAKNIGIYAFAECVRLETAEIKSSISVVPNGLFSGCISLSSTNIPYSVTAIGKYAYYNNTKLTKAVIPAAVSKIGEFAFWNNTVLSEINFPDTLRTIERYAFYACASFTDIVLPNEITSIGDYAFAMCIKMTSINIPDKIEVLGSAVLDKDTVLSTISLPSQLKLLTLFGSEEAIPFAISAVTYTEGNGYLADNALSNLLKIQRVIIGEGIRVIGAYAFNNCENLTEIVLPSTLVSIKKGAFMDTKITEINLSDNIIDIGEAAFANCQALSSIVLPSQISYLGEDIFYGCSALTTVDASACTQLYTIGNYAFMNCIGLTSFILPSTVALIGNWAFAGCTALSTFTVNEDSLLNAVGHYAFKDCVNLKAFRLPVSVMSLGWGVFYSCSAMQTFTVDVGRDYDEAKKLSNNLGLFIFFGTSINDIEDIDISYENAQEYALFTEYLAKEGELQNVNQEIE